MTKPREEAKLVLYDPKLFSPRLYRIMAQEISPERIPVFSGRYAYFHLNNMREYLDNLLILQVYPTLPREVLKHARALKNSGVTFVVVDTRSIYNRKNANPFADDDAFYALPGEKFQILDFDAAGRMLESSAYGTWPDGKFYTNFADMIMRKHNSGGVLEGASPAHMRRLRDVFERRGAKIREIGIPPAKPDEALQMAKSGKVLVNDARENVNGTDWNGFFIADIDRMLYYSSIV